MQTFEINGARMAAQIVGAGPTLLLVHGFPLDHTMWRRQFEQFSQSFRVVAPDLPGFGQSELAAGRTMSMRGYADALAALVDQVAPGEPIVFCGLSMGGYIAFQFWHGYRDRLSRLVLCDTRAVADTPQAREGRKQLSAKTLAEGPSAAAEAMLPKLFWTETQSRDPRAIEETRAAMMRASPQGIAAALGGMAERPDVTEWLGQIEAPTLVVAGEHDGIATPDEMRGFAARIPNARFAVLPDAGHMAPLENPAAFNQLLSDFLSRPK